MPIADEILLPNLDQPDRGHFRSRVFCSRYADPARTAAFVQWAERCVKTILTKLPGHNLTVRAMRKNA
jgi:hypothetical protein